MMLLCLHCAPSAIPKQNVSHQPRPCLHLAVGGTNHSARTACTDGTNIQKNGSASNQNADPHKKKTDTEIESEIRHAKKTRGAIIQRSMTCHTSSCHDSPRQTSLLYQPPNSTVKYTSPPPAAATSASGEATPISPPFAASDVSWSVRAFRGHSPASRGTTAGCPATGYRTSYPSSPPRRSNAIHALRA